MAHLAHEVSAIDEVVESFEMVSQVVHLIVLREWPGWTLMKAGYSVRTVPVKDCSN